MGEWNEWLPWFGMMAALLGCSAFFSASEAALFSLRPSSRRELARTASGRAASELLADPDRLLSAVLFWNLVVNLGYFSTVTIVGFKMDEANTPPWISWLFAAGSLFCVILLSEMLPKTVGVLGANRLAHLIGRPLRATVCAADPLMPVLQVVNRISQRLLWPGLPLEPYMELHDLEQVIRVSREDEALADQERIVLNNIVSLSDIRVDEWMRPRTQFVTFSPPVSLADLNGEMTPSGYLLIAEDDGSDEISAALHLNSVSVLNGDSLEDLASPVTTLPWCATVADALEALVDTEWGVATIVNEYGDTIGILTREDILATVFHYSPSRSKLLMNEKPIHDIAENQWIVSGMTSLRRLSKYLDMPLPHSKSVTVAGVVQEQCHKLAEEGDECDWGPFHLSVIEAPHRGHMLIRILRKLPPGEENA